MKEKLKTILSIQNIIYIICILIFFGLFIFDLKKGNHNLITYIAFIGVGVIICLLIILFIKLFKKCKYTNYHKLYLIIVTIIGIIFMITAPPFMGSDEKTHFLRAYEITEGHIISRTNENGILAYMPRSLNKAYSGYDDENIPLKKSITYGDIHSRLSIPLDKNNLLGYCNCNMTNYFGASLYSPVQYIPHIIGIIIGKVLNFGPIILLYLARIFNFFCFVLLTTFGVKLLPKFKLPFMLILLSPVVLAGATTVSADGLTNAITFLFVAYIINIIYNKKQIKVKDKIILSLITFFIAMCKIVYIPIIFLVLLIPKDCFKSNKDSLLFKILLLMIGFVSSFAWLYLATLFMDSQSNASNLHKQFLLQHPIEYIFILIRTYFLQFDKNILNLFFGNQLYHWQLKVYPILSILYAIIIFLSFFSEKVNFNLSKKNKIFIGCIMVLIIGLISTALFVQAGMDIENNIIGGIQARYFIPILFLIPLLISIKKIKYSNEYIFILFCLLYLPTIFTIIVRFI